MSASQKVYCEMTQMELDFEVVRLSRKPTELLSLGFTVISIQLDDAQRDINEERFTKGGKIEVMLRYGIVSKAITMKLFNEDSEESSLLS